MTHVAELLHLFAVAAPGLEPLVHDELRALRIAARPEPGGVAWEGTAEQLMEANLRLRTASRVLVRVAEFPAQAFYELERQARRVCWEDYVAPGATVRLRVTARSSRLYHQRAVAERVLEAVERRVGGLGAGSGAAEAEDEGAGAQLFVVRLFHNRCTISADGSGELLHRRGYREAMAKAPLRETLAAAMLLGSGWRPHVPLLDPLCGSGTIAIEAALLARQIAPGLAHPDGLRRYAFERWPGFDAGLWGEVVARARAEVRSAAPAPIRASDRDAGAVRAAHANALRAGVAGDVALDVRALSAVEPPTHPGWLLANPPYGQRVGAVEALRDLYAALGHLARRRLGGWWLALLSADRRLEGQVGVRFQEALRTTNGGIPVRLVVGRVGE